MTLPDTVYQDMRNQAKLMMKELGSFAGAVILVFCQLETEEVHFHRDESEGVKSSALASKVTISDC